MRWNWWSSIEIAHTLIFTSNTKEVSSISDSLSKWVYWFGRYAKLQEVEDLLFSIGHLIYAIHFIMRPDLWIGFPIIYLEYHASFLGISSLLNISNFHGFLLGGEILNEHFAISELHIKLSFVVRNIGFKGSPESTNSLLFTPSLLLAYLTVWLQIDAVLVTSSRSAFSACVVIIIALSVYSWFAIISALCLVHCSCVV